MPSFQVTPDQLVTAMARLGLSIRREAAQAMVAAAWRTQRHIVTEVIPRAKPRPPIGVSGLYRSSWHVTGYRAGALLYNDAPHAGIVELGRRPGPISRAGRRGIYRWIRRVLQLDEKEARRALFPIVRAITKRGWKGQDHGARHILRNAMSAARRFAEAETVAAFARVDATARA